jgi:hypothetical protein
MPKNPADEVSASNFNELLSLSALDFVQDARKPNATAMEYPE